MTELGEWLDAQVVKYFKHNPDEELTIDDIASKFGVDRTSAKTAAYRLSNRGEVEIHQVIRRPRAFDGDDQ